MEPLWGDAIALLAGDAAPKMHWDWRHTSPSLSGVIQKHGALLTVPGGPFSSAPSSLSECDEAAGLPERNGGASDASIFCSDINNKTVPSMDAALLTFSLPRSAFIYSMHRDCPW